MFPIEALHLLDRQFRVLEIPSQDSDTLYKANISESLLSRSRLFFLEKNQGTMCKHYTHVLGHLRQDTGILCGPIQRAEDKSF